MSVKIYLLSMILSNCNLCFKLYYLFGCISSYQAWDVVATMEVASASFHFCLLGSKVFIFHYFYYHFAFVELVVWFDECFTTLFIWFCTIFAFPTHFVFDVTPIRLIALGQCLGPFLFNFF